MPENDDSMAKEDRARLILEYMAEHSVAMSPGLWHANLEIDKSVTFSYDTTRRRIHDFTAKGWATRFDVDQGIYRITDAGVEAAESGLSDDEISDVIGMSGE